jgi:hypothetical protein
MRVATLNTWGMRGDWQARLPVLRDGLRALAADIVVLQETILVAGTDQAADLLGPGYHLAQQQDREKDGQGITTASRWPLGRVLEVDFHVTGRTYDFACTCLVTEVLARSRMAVSGWPTISLTTSSTMSGNAVCSRPRPRANWSRWSRNIPGT